MVRSKVVRPNQVWSTDITYIRLAHGFAYLVAILDWYSRCVLSWRISNSMKSVFCVDCLEEALHTHGKPEIFNSDQGSQFTSEAFTGVLKREGVVISMDGRRRGGGTPCFATLHRGFLLRKGKIKSNSKDQSRAKQGKTGAAPSSCK